MAQLKSTTINGNLTVSGDILMPIGSENNASLNKYLQLEHGSGISTSYLVGTPELYWNKFGHICVVSLAFQVNSDGVAGNGTTIATGFPKAWYQTQMGIVTQGTDSSNALGVDVNGNLRVWYLGKLVAGTYRGAIVYICE